VEGQAYLLNRQ